MDVRELIRTWPTWIRANAETVISSPAWRMSVRVGGADCPLTVASEPVEDAIEIAVSFEGEDHVLALGDSAFYPDLHLLWAKRRDLPPNVLLALVEKECGDVFQMLENAVRKQFAVSGFAPPSPTGVRGTSFRVETAGGSVPFALDLSPALAMAFGRLDHLDPGHPSIRAMTRPARVDCGSFILKEEEVSALEPGDCLLFPEAACAVWTCSDPTDDAVHAYSAGTTEITFAQFADDALPPVPDPESFALVRRDRTLARGTPVRVGVAKAVRIDPA